MTRRSTIYSTFRGFTMLEIVIVILVVATAASLITLRLTNQEDTLFLRQFVLTLQRARIQAMETGAMDQLVLFEGGAAYMRWNDDEEREIPENVVLWPVGGKDAESAVGQAVVICFYADGSARITAANQPEAHITDLDVVFDERRIYRVSLHPFNGIRCRRLHSNQEVAS